MGGKQVCTLEELDEIIARFRVVKLLDKLMPSDYNDLVEAVKCIRNLIAVIVAPPPPIVKQVKYKCLETDEGIIGVTEWTDIPNMVLSIETGENKLLVLASCSILVRRNGFLRILVDGVPAKGMMYSGVYITDVADLALFHSGAVIHQQPIQAGTHEIKLQWRVNVTEGYMDCPAYTAPDYYHISLLAIEHV